MSGADDIQDEVAYIGLKEREHHLQLYASTQEKDFHDQVRQKLQRKKPTSFDADKKKTKLRQYLQDKVPAIAASLKLTVVTDFETDHLLTVKRESTCFVYFGAMTQEELIHVACWLRIPMTEGKVIDTVHPQILFWVLHMSYAQELEALGELEGLSEEDIKISLDLTSI
jgi:hypothetical protein